MYKRQFEICYRSITRCRLIHELSNRILQRSACIDLGLGGLALALVGKPASLTQCGLIVGCDGAVTHELFEGIAFLIGLATQVSLTIQRILARITGAHLGWRSRILRAVGRTRYSVQLILRAVNISLGGLQTILGLLRTLASLLGERLRIMQIDERLIHRLLQPTNLKVDAIDISLNVSDGRN